MSNTYARILSAVVRVATCHQKKWRRAVTRLKISQDLLQVHETETPKGTIIFKSYDPQALDYPKNLLTREPDTVAWIDTFETPCVFWDIGANIGAYSLYAALHDKIKVFAFEPAYATYASLCENIFFNKMDDRISAYCVAISHETRLGHLNMAHINPASVCHAFESSKTSDGTEIISKFRQAVIGFSGDDWQKQFNTELPNYLKIDVDSIEIDILRGMPSILTSKMLRSVLIEATYDQDRIAQLDQILGDAGFVGKTVALSENRVYSRPN